MHQLLPEFDNQKMDSIVICTVKVVLVFIRKERKMSGLPPYFSLRSITLLFRVKKALVL